MDNKKETGLEPLTDNTTLQVPAHGQLKLKFRNWEKCPKKVTATMQSLRFGILEANYGKYPTPQFAKELAPGEEGHITIIDRKLPKSIENLETLEPCFKEGRIRFEVLSEWKKWCMPSLFVQSVAEKDNRILLSRGVPVYMVSQNDDVIRTRHFLDMDTPSYKKLKKKVQELREKLGEKSDSTSEKTRKTEKKRNTPKRQNYTDKGIQSGRRKKTNKT